MTERLERLQARAADGRALDVMVAGPPGGGVVLFHHGTPGSPLLLSAQARAGAARGLRHVTYARPGTRGSTARRAAASPTARPTRPPCSTTSAPTLRHGGLVGRRPARAGLRRAAARPRAARAA